MTDSIDGASRIVATRRTWLPTQSVRDLASRSLERPSQFEVERLGSRRQLATRRVISLTGRQGGKVRASNKERARRLGIEMTVNGRTLDVPTLEGWLWDAACQIRGPLDAPKFKDYILP